MTKNVFFNYLSYSLIVCLFVVSTAHGDSSSLEDRTNYCKSIYENSNDLTEAEKEVLMRVNASQEQHEKKAVVDDDSFIVISMNVRANKPHEVVVHGRS